MVALQPYQAPDVVVADYERFIDRAQRGLMGYQDDQWTFVDVHRFFREQRLFDPAHPLAARVHLNDEQQKVVAGILTGPIAEIIRRKRGLEDGSAPQPR